MKKLYPCLIIVCVFACKKTPMMAPELVPRENHPPGTFSIQLKEVSYDSATIEWSPAYDPDNEQVNYSIYLNDSLFATNYLQVTYTFKSLISLKEYNVKIVAKDSLLLEQSALFKFSTSRYFLKYFKQISYGNISNNSMQATSQMIRGNDGGFIITGKTEQLHQPSYPLKFFAMKIDTLGNEIWKKYYDDDSSASRESCIASTPDGYVIGGARQLLKIDNSGNLQWRNTSYSPDEIITAVDVNNAGEIYTVGTASGDMQTDFVRAAVSKFDAHGNKIWNKILSPTIIDGFTDIKVINDDEMILLGFTDGNNVTYDEFIHTTRVENLDYWVVNINGTGDVNWSKTFVDPGYAFPKNIIQTKEGSYVFVGFTQRHNNELPIFYMSMVDSSGNFTWDYFNPDNHTLAYSVAETSDNSLVVAGGYQLSYSAQSALYKFDKQGKQLWEKLYGEAFTYLFNKTVISTPDGGYMVAAQKANYGYDQIYIFKTDEEGNWGQ